MIKIEIESVEIRRVVKKETGECFDIPEVRAYVHGIDRYPKAIRFGVAKGEPHPKPGMYELDPASFFVGKFDALSVRSQLVLKPIAAAAVQSPRAA